MYELEKVDHDHLAMRELISQQESACGSNMYESLVQEDEEMIDHYFKQGYTLEEAILEIFNQRFKTTFELPASHPIIYPAKEVTGISSSSSVGSLSPDKKDVRFNAAPSSSSSVNDLSGAYRDGKGIPINRYSSGSSISSHNNSHSQRVSSNRGSYHSQSNYMRNDTDDNVSIASSMTAATNYRNSGSRPISGNSLVQHFPPPSINRYQSSSSSSTMNNHSLPISSSSLSFISRQTNLWIIIDEVLSIFIFFASRTFSSASTRFSR